MKIEVTHFRLIDNALIRAVASILIDSQLAVHDIKILQYSHSKIVVAMPSKKDGHGGYRDMVHPITERLRQQVNDLLLQEYEKARNDR